jgi:hypothetical protein
LSLGAAASAVAPGAYSAWEASAKVRWPPVLWEAASWTLGLPFFLAALVVAIVLALIGRRPRKLIGYSSRD